MLVFIKSSYFDYLLFDKFEAGIFHNINFKQEPLRLEASLRIIIDVDALTGGFNLQIAYSTGFTAGMKNF